MKMKIELDVRSFIRVAGIAFFMGMIAGVIADEDEGKQLQARVVENPAGKQTLTAVTLAGSQDRDLMCVALRRESAPSRGKEGTSSKGLQKATAKGAVSKKEGFQLSPEEIELLKSLSTTPPQEEPTEATKPEEPVDESDSPFTASEFAYQEPTKTFTPPTATETTTSEIESFLKSLEEKKEKKDGSPQK